MLEYILQWQSKFLHQARVDFDFVDVGVAVVVATVVAVVVATVVAVDVAVVVVVGAAAQVFSWLNVSSFERWSADDGFDRYQNSD